MFNIEGSNREWEDQWPGRKELLDFRFTLFCHLYHYNERAKAITWVKHLVKNSNPKIFTPAPQSLNSTSFSAVDRSPFLILYKCVSSFLDRYSVCLHTNTSSSVPRSSDLICSTASWDYSTPDTDKQSRLPWGSFKPQCSSHSVTLLAHFGKIVLGPALLLQLNFLK